MPVIPKTQKNFFYIFLEINMNISLNTHTHTYTDFKDRFGIIL